MSYPSPQKSITYPLDRKPGARSKRVGATPARLSQYASVGPAIPAPHTSTALVRTDLSDRYFVKIARAHAIPAAAAVRRRKMPGAHGIGRAARHPQRCRAVGADPAVDLHAAAAIDDGAVHDLAGEPIRRVAGPASGID